MFFTTSQQIKLCAERVRACGVLMRRMDTGYKIVTAFLHLLLSPMETRTSRPMCLSTEVSSMTHKSAGSRRAVSSKKRHHEGTAGWKGNLESCAQPLTLNKTHPELPGELEEVSIHHLAIRINFSSRQCHGQDHTLLCPSNWELWSPVLSMWIHCRCLPSQTQKTNIVLPKRLICFLSKETNLS